MDRLSWLWLDRTQRTDDSSSRLMIAIAVIVLVVVVLVALIVDQPGTPTADPEGAVQPSEERPTVTLVRPPAWIPAERLAAPSPASR